MIDDLVKEVIFVFRSRAFLLRLRALSLIWIGNFDRESVFWTNVVQ